MRANANLVGAAAAAVLTLAWSPSSSLAQEAKLKWVETPEPEHLSAVYPPGALAAGLAGRATMRCRLRPDGSLETCRVDQESPPGAGFGAASLLLAPRFRAEAGLAPAVEVVIPLRFEPPPAPPPRDVRFPRSARSWPGLGQVGGYYPERAAREGREGAATMDCRVAEMDQLRDCRLVAVSPRDFGFEDSFRRMAQDGWILAGPPAPGMDSPEDGVWRFTVRFRLTGRRVR
jgi:TonB family protein